MEETLDHHEDEMRDGKVLGNNIYKSLYLGDMSMFRV